MTTSEQKTLRFLREAEEAADQAHACMKDAGLEWVAVRMGGTILTVESISHVLTRLIDSTEDAILERAAEAAREDAEAMEAGADRTPPRE